MSGHNPAIVCLSVLFSNPTKFKPQLGFDPRPQSFHHKVLTYIEYRAVSSVFRTIDPHPLSTQRVCPPPAPKAGGGVHTRQAVRGWGGSTFRKTPDVGLASFCIIPLRFQVLNSGGKCCVELSLEESEANAAASCLRNHLRTSHM